jgi:hypothetical protein
MSGGWRYRIGSVFGVAVLTGFAVALVNSPTAQALIGSLPVTSQLTMDPPSGAEGFLEVFTTVVVVTAVFVPLYKPRPRRILDTAVLAQKRVIVALLALAAIGYFDYTYRLPRTTLLAIAPVLLTMLPAWFVWIRRRPTSGSQRAIVVGDDPSEIESLAADIDIPLLGYLCPTNAFKSDAERNPAATVADGGFILQGMDRLGGLSRIEDVLVEYDVDTVILAFEHTDRAEFFGALDACYEHGVNAKVHRGHADQVLTADSDIGTLVSVDVEPWDIQDYALKRGFDLAFSTFGLLALSP